MGLGLTQPYETQNGNFRLEGYSTGRNVLRIVTLLLQPGGTPNTNINISEVSAAGWNAPTINDATNLAKSASSGSFALNSGGTIITMDITEDIVLATITNINVHDLNSSSTTELYFPHTGLSSNNMQIKIVRRGSSTLKDWTSLLDGGDLVEITFLIITSS